MSNIQKWKGEFKEELKSPDKKGISTKRKIGKTTYESTIISRQNNPSLAQPN